MAEENLDQHEPTPVQEYWSSALRPRLALTASVAPLSSAETINNARQTVEEDLEAVQHLLCALKSRKNAFSPISSLPPEILAYVFQIHMENPRWYYHRSGSHNPPLEWIVVTQVCRHWRQVALSQPRLWTLIPFTFGPKWTERFFERAKHAPIRLHQTLGGTVDPSSQFDFILNHLHHTEELVLSGSVPSIQDALQTLTSGAPYLECFQIAPSPLPVPSLPLPARLFANNAPKLRRLTLHGFTIPWSSTLLTNLTVLDINIAPGPLTSFLFSDIMTGLGRMHFLQKFTLVGGLPTWNASYPDDAVSLPHLAQIVLQGPPRTSYELLNRLHTPSQVKINLTCSFASSVQDPLADLERINAMFLSRLPSRMRVVSVPSASGHQDISPRVPSRSSSRRFPSKPAFFDPTTCFCSL
ncbi:hypothetical protein OF83DRAFT_855473 [Amylostereum chailletii]|nr:hypothetical protein OF83DRAFT_855473 [Amylostereum chailletii]